MSINHKEKYISFGSTNPLLCLKFTLQDDGDSPAFQDIPLYFKFSFHLHWSVEDYTTNAEVDDMVEAGELEFF